MLMSRIQKSPPTEVFKLYTHQCQSIGCLPPNTMTAVSKKKHPFLFILHYAGLDQ